MNTLIPQDKEGNEFFAKDNLGKSYYAKDVCKNEIYPIDKDKKAIVAKDTSGTFFYAKDEKENEIYPKDENGVEYLVEKNKYAYDNRNILKYPKDKNGRSMYPTNNLGEQYYIDQVYGRDKDGNQFYAKNLDQDEFYAPRIVAERNDGTPIYAKKRNGEIIFPIDNFGEYYITSTLFDSYNYLIKSGGNIRYAVRNNKEIYPIFSTKGRNGILKIEKILNNKYATNISKEFYYPLDENGNEYVLSDLENEPEALVNIYPITNDNLYIVPNLNGSRIRYERLGRETFKKILPYFETRLETGKLEYVNKPFYKVYAEANLEDVGLFFNKYKIAYFEKMDWLVRIYIDMCKKTDLPNCTLASFDLETVPLSGENRVPTGIDSMDRVVMISIVKWNQHIVKYFLLYLTPCPKSEPLKALPLHYDENIIDYELIAFNTERELLIHFHKLIDDVHVLTGYNINNFDFPCIFARLVWLQMNNILKYYSSKNIGDYLVTTYRGKIVIDMYNYFKIFSSYNLPGFKLDDVAKAKLGKAKISLKSTGIHYWYSTKKATPELLRCPDVKKCYDLLNPHSLREDQFGTFRKYLEYCLIDSELVRLLFQKETALHFLIERANFTAMDVVHALHYGNSRYLLELFKTYGTLLGYFINIRFFKNMTEPEKYKSMFVNDTYQGALNYCIPESYYEDISVMDFTSMYPCSLLSSNLCYGTCTILTNEEYLASPVAHTLTAIPFRNHSEEDFLNCKMKKEILDETYQYPSFNPETDKFVVIVNQKTKAFLPELVLHLLNLRKFHQKEWKSTKNVYHYNAQLNIKILINSLYGIMASKDSCLAKLVIAITIVTLARYQLLGSFNFMVQNGYDVCYADTDSLMVHRWPVDNCDSVNKYLNLPHVEIKFENRFKKLLIISKKRYIFELDTGKYITKGFQKKSNELIDYMTNKILKSAMENFNVGRDPSQGWVIWVETLNEAFYKCRDPKKYSISRKTKNIDEYKSTTCATVKMLQKYPEKSGEYIEYTYSRADIAAKETLKWIMDVDEVKYVNFEQLFMSQKKIFITLLNISFWNMQNPFEPCQKVLNTLKWKSFLHAELLHWFNTREKILILVERGIKYSFEINDHLNCKCRRKRLIRK
ncbi:DNA polymerase [Trichonephila inaurata madagascariensis]|uniref:DNA polymerase n=1 Tax=Trichonephila inaurata madagascariensis TaxID=2747483 RepID=A0A8X7CIK2_9ARAC|nr:DNA polymerase [Trichonephila inaurata madagascariensis]